MIDYPPDNYTLDILHWLRDEIYSSADGQRRGLVDHPFTDRDEAVWLAGSGGFIGLWSTGYGNNLPPAERLQACREELYRRIYRVVNPPSASVGQRPIVGQLGCDGRGFYDTSGRRVVVSCHAGDLIGQGLIRGLDHVLPALDQMASAGYQIVRSWFNVDAAPDNRFWGNKPAPRWSLLDNPALFMEILQAAKDRGLRWHLASGGLDGMGNGRENQMFDLVTEAMRQLGPDTIAHLEACNEIQDTGDRDDLDPAELTRLIDRVRVHFPNVLYSLTAYTGTEDREIHRRYTADFQKFVLEHSYRAGRAHDKIRHLMSGVYEDLPTLPRPNKWYGEPFGVTRTDGPFGQLVSVQDNSHELLDPNTMQLAAAIASMRGLWTFFCDPGIILFDEPFPTVPGFLETPALVNRLPQDLATYRTMGHGGDRAGSPRIHSAVDDWRPDYVIHDDGCYLEVTYGPPEQREEFLRRTQTCRPTRDVERLATGPWGWIETGRLA